MAAKRRSKSASSHAADAVLDAGAPVALRQHQWHKLERLLHTIVPRNAFYRARLGEDFHPTSLEEFCRICPTMDKGDLVRDRELNAPFGSNLTWPLDRYTRFCQTSGTKGKPLAWLDTAEDWASMLRCWQTVFERAGVEAGRDRVFFAFSFGPFLGFWTAFEAALKMGILAIPAGGLSTIARLRTLEESRATVLCCTPTYAVRLGEARNEQGKTNAVRLIIVAGEPGGSIPATRERIERLWRGAKVFDHHGLTEVGPVTYEDPTSPCTLRVMEEHYFAEVLHPGTNRPVEDGSKGELVLTTLDREGCPLLRFRTGDMVLKRRSTEDGGLCLDGGILSRVDDMVVVRGVNVYPGAIEGVLRRFPEVVEYQVREDWSDAMLELHLVVELASDRPEETVNAIQQALMDAFSLRIPVEVFPVGSLPRFEFKARRWLKAPPMGHEIAPTSDEPRAAIFPNPSAADFDV